jgi:hypothetical protein
VYEHDLGHGFCCCLKLYLAKNIKVMEAAQITMRGTGARYALITVTLFIAFFLAMRAAGYANVTTLRFVNYAFLGLGIWLAFHHVQHLMHKHRISYLPGMILGFVMVFFTSLIYTIFIFIYSKFIDISFIPLISSDLPYYSAGLNAYIIGICIFFESMVVGVFFSFIAMQYFKRNRASEFEALDEAEEKLSA